MKVKQRGVETRDECFIPFIGKALVVKDKYLPEYQFTSNAGGNHTFKVTPDSENQFEYMLFAGWSKGAVYSNQEVFETYVRKMALELMSLLTYHLSN